MLLVFIFLGISSHIFAQGGAQMMSGIAFAGNVHPDITPEGLFQSGFSVAIQSRLKDGKFVAGPGLRYSRISMVANDEVNLFVKKENYHFLTIPLNIGLEYRLAHAWKLRMYVGPDATYFFKIDENSGTEASRKNGINTIDFDYVKDYFLGAHAGIGIDLYWLTFDISFEKGLTDAHALKNSSYNFITTSVGFFF